MSTLAPSTPSRAHSAAARAELLANSPHYSTTRRHSPYGTEDRIILDPGSRLWKVGFSGEGRPREVFAVQSLAILEGSTMLSTEEREEAEKMAEHILQEQLRRIFFDSLLTDPKSRKLIILEGPLVPLVLKDMLARILFRNLQVPSISFTPSHVMSILASGRVTGLVLDCGHLESTVLPVYSCRPLLSYLKTTPLAGSRLSSHLRSLILTFGSYYRPRNFRPSAGPPEATKIPEELLTEALIEDIKTRCCFVGPILEPAPQSARSVNTGGAVGESPILETGRSSRISIATDGASALTASGASSASPDPEPARGSFEALASHYRSNSTSTDVSIRVITPPSHVVEAGTGPQARGTIVIPGWVRERAAEILFEGGDVDERSVVEILLDSLLKVPIDLRKDLASAILIVGGTSMLPGFIPRIQAELLRLLALTSPISRRDVRTTPIPRDSTPPQTPTAATQTRRSTPVTPRRSPYSPYSTLGCLAPFIAILNNPSPKLATYTSTQARSTAGKAPGFAPALMPWVGASLAGALKIGGEELTRETWDEEYEHDLREYQTEAMEVDDLADVSGQSLDQSPSLGRRPPGFNFLPDWTRVALSVGAPPARPVSVQQ